MKLPHIISLVIIVLSILLGVYLYFYNPDLEIGIVGIPAIIIFGLAFPLGFAGEDD